MAAAAYPGSFDPPTVAHLAVATAAWRQAGLERVDLVISEAPLGKEGLAVATLADRLAVLSEVAATRRWLGARTTNARLLVDVAAGYDAVIVGADKWAQVIDPAWYGGSAEARDEALARLPLVLVAPRPPFPLPPGRQCLELDDSHGAVSSSAVRGGRREWMLSEAAAFDRLTGAWSGPGRHRPRRES
ncbi:MAG TPA: hypothetical protein VG184_05135 [Acidimicrobiales bacterium]|nr:hypothetical protein [Acidimicrobiales bacterium]